jgi:ubiquinone/menaquinone biosynthesis C-methylase UbiE
MDNKIKNDLLESQYKDPSGLDVRIGIHEQYSTNKYGLHRWVFDQLNLSDTARIIELGCGTGMLWYRNKDRIPKSWVLILTDISHGMSIETKRKLSTTSNFVLYMDVHAEEIPFPEATFDAVVANHMLYHTSDLHKALAEIQRVLKGGGKLFAVTNGKDHFRELWEAVSEFDVAVRDILDLRPRDIFSWQKFCLENGEEKLREFFPQVYTIPYSDSLQVKDVRVLTDWLSSFPGNPIACGELDEFGLFLEEKKADRDSFVVSKHIGLFIARKTNDG